MLRTLVPIVVVNAVFGSGNLILIVLINLQAVLQRWCSECATSILTLCFDAGWGWIIYTRTINSILLVLPILVCGVECNTVSTFTYVLEISSINRGLMVMWRLLLFLLLNLLISLIDNLLLLFLLPLFTWAESGWSLGHVHRIHINLIIIIIVGSATVTETSWDLLIMHLGPRWELNRVNLISNIIDHFLLLVYVYGSALGMMMLIINLSLWITPLSSLVIRTHNNNILVLYLADCWSVALRMRFVTLIDYALI